MDRFSHRGSACPPQDGGRHVRSPGFMAAMAGLVILGPLSLTLYVPLVPLVRSEFSAGVAETQLSLSLGMLAATLACAIAGWAADRAGRRAVVIVSLLTFLAGCALCAAAPSLAWVTLGRVILSAAGSCALVIVRAIVADLWEGDDATRFYTLLTVIPLAAMVTGPVAGGFLADSFGWRPVFWGLVALGLATAAAAWRGLPETRRTVPPACRAAEGNGVLLRSPLFLSYLLVASLHFGVLMAFIASAPHVLAPYGQSAGQTSLWLMGVGLMLIVGTGIGGKTAPKLGAAGLVALGSLLAPLLCALAVTMGPLWLPSGAIWLLFLPAMAGVVGMGMTTSALQSAIMAVAPGKTGLVAGLVNAVPMIAAVIAIQYAAGHLDESAAGHLQWMAIAALAVAALAALTPYATRKT